MSAVRKPLDEKEILTNLQTSALAAVELPKLRADLGASFGTTKKKIVEAKNLPDLMDAVADIFSYSQTAKYKTELKDFKTHHDNATKYFKEIIEISRQYKRLMEAREKDTAEIATLKADLEAAHKNTAEEKAKEEQLRKENEELRRKLHEKTEQYDKVADVIAAANKRSEKTEKELTELQAELRVKDARLKEYEKLEKQRSEIYQAPPALPRGPVSFQTPSQGKGTGSVSDAKFTKQVATQEGVRSAPLVEHSEAWFDDLFLCFTPQAIEVINFIKSGIGTLDDSESTKKDSLENEKYRILLEKYLNAFVTMYIETINEGITTTQLNQRLVETSEEFKELTFPPLSESEDRLSTLNKKLRTSATSNITLKFYQLMFKAYNYGYFPGNEEYKQEFAKKATQEHQRAEQEAKLKAAQAKSGTGSKVTLLLSAAPPAKKPTAPVETKTQAQTPGQARNSQAAGLPPRPAPATTAINGKFAASKGVGAKPLQIHTTNAILKPA